MLTVGATHAIVRPALRELRDESANRCAKNDHRVGIFRIAPALQRTFSQLRTIAWPLIGPASRIDRRGN
jgi:hypothetical protein